MLRQKDEVNLQVKAMLPSLEFIVRARACSTYYNC